MTMRDLYPNLENNLLQKLSMIFFHVSDEHLHFALFVLGPIVSPLFL